MIGVFNVILATFSHLRIGQMMLSLMFDHQPYQYYGELDLLRSIYPYLSLCLRRVLRSIIPCLWLTTVFLSSFGLASHLHQDFEHAGTGSWFQVMSYPKMYLFMSETGFHVPILCNVASLFCIIF